MITLQKKNNNSAIGNNLEIMNCFRKKKVHPKIIFDTDKLISEIAEEIFEEVHESREHKEKNTNFLLEIYIEKKGLKVFSINVSEEARKKEEFLNNLKKYLKFILTDKEGTDLKNIKEEIKIKLFFLNIRKYIEYTNIKSCVAI